MGSSSNGVISPVFKGSPDRGVIQGVTHRNSLNSEEVLIRITHSSLYGIAEHYLNADMCLEHGGAGVVEALRPDTKALKVYDHLSSPYFVFSRHSTISTNKVFVSRGDNFAFGYQR